MFTTLVPGLFYVGIEKGVGDMEFDESVSISSAVRGHKTAMRIGISKDELRVVNTSSSLFLGSNSLPPRLMQSCLASHLTQHTSD